MQINYINKIYIMIIPTLAIVMALAIAVPVPPQPHCIS